ncbi:VOC family protein [Rhizobium laguerreae]|uniref:VOC family protein n=1 Tax=Rhizobium laguerreae TaxID=1076926 RepID=UPI001C90FB8D|nr:VOC family protein [Rhizobium laguerreae]MBY3537524.1 VOC family protein [Rhizobium laguerreae]
MPQKIPTEKIGLSRANHVGIVVSDLASSIKFYEALTGTKIENVDQIGGPRMAAVQGMEKVLIKYANVHLDNLNIDLLQYDEPKPKTASYQGNDIGAMHLCFEVDDLDAVYRRMKDAGLEFSGEPIIFEDGDGLKKGAGTAVAYFDDPDGTHLEIIAPKGPFKRK